MNGRTGGVVGIVTIVTFMAASLQVVPLRDPSTGTVHRDSEGHPVGVSLIIAQFREAVGVRGLGDAGRDMVAPDRRRHADPAPGPGGDLPRGGADGPGQPKRRPARL